MEIILFIVVMIVIVVKQAAKMKGGGSGSGSSSSAASRTSQPSQPGRSSSAPNRYSASGNAGSFNRQPYSRPGRPTATVNQRDGRVYASIDFDNTHYHAEGFDFDCCISFKGLPPGTDELAVLIASNTRHERELAKRMKDRQA